jgi:phosphoglycolate phosphatase
MAVAHPGTVGAHAGEPDTLFFDLDGTLIDSEVGITHCVAHAFTQMGRPVPPHAELRRWIGPSLRISFADVFDDPAQIEQAVAWYRERFDAVGWREHTIYPGIEQVVRDLHARGHRLAIVTAKNEPHARRIIEHLPFGELFVDVIGATPDGSRSSKAQLVGEALRRLMLPAQQCWMIGDRRMDIEGAQHHQMRNIGVLWGFGGTAELQAAGAQHLAATPEALLSLLG